jgi:hypothetical protein
MGLLRKYGLAFVIILAMTFFMSLPSWITNLIPSFTGSGIDTIFIFLACALIFVLYKG